MILVAAVALFLLLAHALAPRAMERFFGFLESIFARISHRPTFALAFLFFGIIAVRIALLSLLPVPSPGIHDEFSYLLMGDTFAHGRLANPTHPMWLSFETFHVNWFPTYSSMYPPHKGLCSLLDNCSACLGLACCSAPPQCAPRLTGCSARGYLRVGHFSAARSPRSNSALPATGRIATGAAQLRQSAARLCSARLREFSSAQICRTQFSSASASPSSPTAARMKASFSACPLHFFSCAGSGKNQRANLQAAASRG